MTSVERTYFSDEHKEELEQVVCLLCGSADASEVLRASDLLLDRPGRYPLVRCGSCGLHYVSPRPTPAALAAHYPDSYACYIPPEETHWLIRPAIVRIAQGLSRKRIGYLERAMGRIQPDTTIVDVGCGNNDLLYTIRQLRGCTGTGLDFNPRVVEMVQQKRNMPMVCGTLESASFDDDQFDVVTMMEYLEHEPSPRAILQQARRILRKGGHLAVELPYFTGWPARLFGANWFNLDLPRHLVFFSPTTIARILRECGFEPLSCTPFALPWYIGGSILLTLGYRYKVLPQIAPFFAAMLAIPFVPFTPLIPEFMFVVARAV